MRKINRIGERFGRLLVIDEAEPLSGKTRWLCKCDCGKTTIVHATSLVTGTTTSCGCYKRENAQRLYSSVRQNDKRLYAVWNGMKQRCQNPNNTAYHNYGGRGIKVDKEWSDNYEAFYNWAIHNGYQYGYEIDRIDNNGDYCSSNCRFVKRDVQANNKRNIKQYTIDGVTKSLPQWCRQYNQDYYLVRQRVYKLGWNIQEALTQPSQQSPNAEKHAKEKDNA